MAGTSYTWPGTPGARPQRPSNGDHQIVPHDIAANSGLVQLNTNPGPYSFNNPSTSNDDSTNGMPGIKCHSNGSRVAACPHPAMPNNVHTEMQGLHHLQNSQGDMQNLPPMYPSFGVQQPVSNGNGHTHSNNDINSNGNGNGNGCNFHGRMPDTHHNTTWNVPGQNNQSTNMVAQQNGTAQLLHEGDPGIPPQMQGNYHNEMFHAPNRPEQDNNMVTYQSGEAQRPYEKFPELPRQYLSPPHPHAQHLPVENGIIIPPRLQSNDVPPMNGGHPIPPIPNSRATNDGIGNHHLHPHIGQNSPLSDHRFGLSLSQIQPICPGDMGTAPRPPTNDMYRIDVYQPNQGISQGNPVTKIGAVNTPAFDQPSVPYHSAPTFDPAVANLGTPAYQPEVHAGSQNSQFPPSGAHAPGRVFSSETMSHSNPSNGGFIMPPKSNEISSGVQHPNGMGAGPRPNATEPDFHNGKQVNGGVQPVNNQDIENTGNTYTGQHANPSNHSFLNRVAHNPTPGPCPNGNSAAAQVGVPYRSPYPKIDIGGSCETHGIDTRVPTAQWPASVPAPTIPPYQDAPVHILDVHSVQRPKFGIPPGPYALTAGAGGTFTYPAIFGCPAPSHPAPANWNVNVSGNEHTHGNRPSPAHAQIQQLPSNPQKENSMRFVVNNRGDRKNVAQKRGQPRKPRGGKVGTGNSPCPPPPPGLWWNGGFQAPMVPGITPVIGNISRVGGVPPVPLGLQPNGCQMAPTSVEMSASASSALQQINSLTPSVNVNHENGIPIHPVMPQGGNSGAHPGSPVLKESGHPPAPAPTAIGMPVRVPVAPTHGMGIAPNVKGMTRDTNNLLLPPDSLDDLLWQFFAGWDSAKEEEMEGTEDPLTSTSSGQSMPFHSTPDALASRVAATMQQEQPVTVSMGEIQVDMDKGFRELMEQIDHDNFPGLLEETLSHTEPSSSRRDTVHPDLGEGFSENFGEKIERVGRVNYNLLSLHGKNQSSIDLSSTQQGTPNLKPDIHSSGGEGNKRAGDDGNEKV
ncbi:hypothetical protein I7I51_00087 [Histoplasma capsulatum]|uniref:Uncharacterized protein n=1 Tax=Ajellomyces capsulatus TaxID=5037 RepID=A0A8A1MCV0_AJECA|nr:hypothetical protein I7I51_00087 [Histoplasma capsulatum]